MVVLRFVVELEVARGGRLDFVRLSKYHVRGKFPHFDIRSTTTSYRITGQETSNSVSAARYGTRFHVHFLLLKRSLTRLCEWAPLTEVRISLLRGCRDPLHFPPTQLSFDCLPDQLPQLLCCPAPASSSPLPPRSILLANVLAASSLPPLDSISTKTSTVCSLV